MRGLDAIKNKHLIRNSGYLNGVFTKGVKAAPPTFNVFNPANGDHLMELPRMGKADADFGASVANDAWYKWKTTNVTDRSKVLAKMAALMVKYQDDLAAIISLEAGKPFAEAKGEVMYATSFYDFYAEEAKRVTGDILQCNNVGTTRRLLVSKQAVGPAALITPWNFPSAMITRKVGPALAAGCTVLIKPAEQTPLSALALCAIAEEAGLPAGVMNCLTVAREEVVEVGTALCHSPLLRKVSFTGSTAVGKWLMRESAGTVKKVSMELGGNAPFIVFDDADLDVALNALLFSKYRNAGQACIASNRVFVQAGVYDKFAQMVTAASQSMHCGTINSNAGHVIAAEPNVTPTIGPLIDDRAIAKVCFLFIYFFICVEGLAILTFVICCGAGERASGGLCEEGRQGADWWYPSRAAERQGRPLLRAHRALRRDQGHAPLLAGDLWARCATLQVQH